MNTNQLLEQIVELISISGKMDSDLAEKISPVLLPPAAQPESTERETRKDRVERDEPTTQLNRALSAILEGLVGTLKDKEILIARISI